MVERREELSFTAKAFLNIFFSHHGLIESESNPKFRVLSFQPLRIVPCLLSYRDR